MSLEFSKYQAAGNDFLIVNGDQITPEFARSLCDRHLGVGADGIIILEPSDVADFSFTLFNADGSLAEVSGNGLRCVGKFLYEKGFKMETNIKVEAAGDIKVLELEVDGNQVKSVRAEMGIPTDEGEVELLGRTWKKVRTGNPHAVTFYDDISQAPVTELGPQVETHAEFPERTNVEFVQIDGDDLHVRFWERGVGVTNSSGTGSCSAAFASGLKKANVRTLGGTLLVEQDDQGRQFLSGPAEHVFDGRWRETR